MSRKWRDIRRKAARFIAGDYGAEGSPAEVRGPDVVIRIDTLTEADPATLKAIGDAASKGNA